jgi:hypothetical protein
LISIRAAALRIIPTIAHIPVVSPIVSLCTLIPPAIVAASVSEVTITNARIWPTNVAIYNDGT